MKSITKQMLIASHEIQTEIELKRKSFEKFECSDLLREKVTPDSNTFADWIPIR